MARIQRKSANAYDEDLAEIDGRSLRLDHRIAS